MKAFLAGLGLGFGIGILIAPRSGKETREQIGSRAGEMADNVREQVSRAARQPAKVLGQGQKKIAELGREFTEQLQNQGEKLKDTVQSKFSSGVLLNSISREDLLSIYGIGPVIADKIIGNRPYTSDRQVVDQGIIPESLFERMTRELAELAKKRA